MLCSFINSPVRRNPNSTQTFFEPVSLSLGLLLSLRASKIYQVQLAVETAIPREEKNCFTLPDKLSGGKGAAQKLKIQRAKT